MNSNKAITCIVCRKKQYLLFPYKSYFYYRCWNCGLVSTLPYPNNKEIKTHYKMGFNKKNYKFLRTYATEYLSVYNQFAEILERKFKQKHESLIKKRVLDIGCFTGDFMELLSKRGANVYGLELQSEAVKIANKRLPGKIVQTDITTHQFSRKKYNAITLLGLIEHVKNPHVLIEQSYRLLTNDGIIMIQTPNSSSFLAHVLGKFWPPYSPVEHIHLFSKKSLELSLKKAGFRDIEFKNHWKNLPIGYVYSMFKTFGPEFRKILSPLEFILRSCPLIFPFYIGEMIVIARKNKIH